MFKLEEIPEQSDDMSRVVDALRSYINNVRNELCFKCGAYRTAHCPDSQCRACRYEPHAAEKEVERIIKGGK